MKISFTPFERWLETSKFNEFALSILDISVCSNDKSSILMVWPVHVTYFRTCSVLLETTKKGLTWRQIYLQRMYPSLKFITPVHSSLHAYAKLQIPLLQNHSNHSPHTWRTFKGQIRSMGAREHFMPFSCTSERNAVGSCGERCFHGTRVVDFVGQYNACCRLSWLHPTITLVAFRFLHSMYVQNLSSKRGWEYGCSSTFELDLVWVETHECVYWAKDTKQTHNHHLRGPWNSREKIAIH